MTGRTKTLTITTISCAVLLAVLRTTAHGASPADLAGHWKLDESSGTTALDSSPGAHSGNLCGNPSWLPTGGKIKGAIELDGLNDYIATGFILNPAGGAFSAFAWVKGGRPNQTIISQTNGAGVGKRWLCTDVAGNLKTELTDGSRFTRPPLTSSVPVTDGKWHCVGVVWDGSYRRLYVDGAEAAADALVLPGLEKADGGLHFGAGKKLDQTTCWSGLLDDVRIYKLALDVPQIRHLAQGGGPEDFGIGVVAVVPKTLYTAAPGSVSLTAVNLADQSPAVAPVVLWLRGNQPTTLQVFEGQTDGSGRVTAQFDIPDIAPGAYTLDISVAGSQSLLSAAVQVRKMPVLLIETDKPIYKPGQTVHGRVLVLTNQLRPTSGQISVEISDGKGVKIFRKSLTANAFGVAPFDLDLASELNFGTWKITAESGSASTAVDVRVEKYVLPRFEVTLDTQKDYFLVDEKISGGVNAAYFFGKPVDGTFEVKASKYIGVWDQYATYTGTLKDGKGEFTLPAAGYVSGTPGAGGSGSVQLELIVTDTSEHQEKTNKLLKIVETAIQHQIVASSRSVTPGRPLEVLLVAETPDGQALTVSAEVTCEFFNQGYGLISKISRSLPQISGSASVSFPAPEKTAWASLRSSVWTKDAKANAELTIYAAYSPSDSFIHLTRASDAPVKVGDTVVIDVFKTHNVTVYYDVYANGRTVWSDFTTVPQITFQATQQMVPAAKVVAYIINPNSEISADTLPLEVTIPNAAELAVQFDAKQVLPGDAVKVSVQAQTKAMVGIAIVDESVYALNKGRLNMQEVFNELERRFMEPQSETHEYPSPCGAYEVFDQAGLQVLTSDSLAVPKGQETWPPWWRGGLPGDGGGGGPVVLPPVGPENDGDKLNAALAEVTRVRQFFPETWLWMPELLTEPDGTSSIDLTAPDSITTWRLHAVSTSKSGLGIAESQLLVFQEFFGEPDLPYAVTRGEQFPVRIQVFNYLDTPQMVQVELTDDEWFNLLEPGIQKVNVAANSVGLASFLIQPTKVGRHILEVTLRSPLRADAVRKELLVEAEGTGREMVTNGMIKAGQTITVDADMPDYRVADSEKLLLSVAPSLVAQSINGVDDLLHMPYGCGEQNMIFFAPDVEILRYLSATDQLTPEVRAKAEHFITVGYQRELTYRRKDGSFSAFGDSDQSGSLWLTAFVLDCFSGARDVQTIDETVLAGAANWITSRQLADGSWEPIGFVHHQEMVGGVSGKYTLTAFVTIALANYGDASADSLAKATAYLKNNLSTVEKDAYALAVAALALAKVKDAAANSAITKLLELAVSDDVGIHWEPHPVETTAYAALAMIETEKPQANAAIKWLAMQQNSHGGFNSTQDTVMGLKALMTAARAQNRNINLTISVYGPDEKVLTQFKIDTTNFDVLQIAELPLTAKVKLTATGSGETRFQLVRRFNVLLKNECIENDMGLEVTYDAKHVHVDDIVSVTATVRYLGRLESSGMMIVDVGVPTGFAPVSESLDALVEAHKVSRVEVAGRKVILYIDGLTAGEIRILTFQVKARFPVRAIIPDSKAYLYYKPEVRAEAQGSQITVASARTMDFSYLATFASQWLKTQAGLDADSDNNGHVDFKDFGILANDWVGQR